MYSSSRRGFRILTVTTSLPHNNNIVNREYVNRTYNVNEIIDNDIV